MKRIRFPIKLIGLCLMALGWAWPSHVLSASAGLGERIGAAIPLIDSAPSRAAEEFADLRSDADPVADYVAYLHALALLRAGDEAQAREGFQDVLKRWPKSPIAQRTAARAVPLLLARGDKTSVINLAERYARDSRESADAAALALAAGQALADTERTQAAEWLLRARRLAPGTAAGAHAASLLSDLRHLAPSLRPTSPRAMLEEAKLAGRERDHELQREMLDRLLSTHADDPQAVDAALLRAKLIVADKGRLDAASWLEQRASRLRTNAGAAKLLHAAAVYRWNADDTEAARNVFERVIARTPESAEAQQSHYSLGRIAEASGRYTAAAAEYREASVGPAAEVARESRWRAGWSAYLASDYRLAAERFLDTARKASDDKGAREQALYWHARSLQRAADEPGADAVYRSLVSEFPDGFYALLVEQRMSVVAPAPEVVRIDRSESERYPELLVVLDRARILEAAGLNDFATRELRIAGSTSDRAAARALLPELLLVGAPDQALRTALALYQDGALRESELYPYIYPHPFAPIVERETKARDLEPSLVYSLMRQESLFDRHAVSPAAAYGLMQLLLSTARRMAAGDPDLTHVSPQDLFRPEINIRLGTAYLAELARRFDNDPVLMLAGYNAGEQAAERWRTRLAGLDRDEFIEQISYRETRDYVKKVLRNYRNYRRLYGNPTGVPTKTVEKPSR